jgi:phytoene dehydrogenase-like protein
MGDNDIGRREWLAWLGAVTVGQFCLACDEPSSNVARSIDGELHGASPERGHLLRDGVSADAFHGAPRRNVDVVIVGGGPSGLSAGWQLRRRGVTNFEVLELEGSIGGTSASDRNAITAYPWGAHYVPVPHRENTALVEFFRDMDALTIDHTGNPVANEEILVRAPDERLFHRGFWVPGLYPHAGESPEDVASVRRFRTRIEEFVAMRDATGRRAFTLPLSACSTDADLVALDRISARSWLEREGFHSERLRWVLEYGCRDDYGAGLDETSAWAMLFYHAARIESPGAESAELMTWPNGNGAIVEHFERRLGRERLLTNAIVLGMNNAGDRVEIRCLRGADRAPEIIAAQSVILAVPKFIAARLIREIDDSRLDDANTFEYSPWVVANLSLRDRPIDRGAPLAWDNVLYDSPSLGYITATHQRGRVHGPTVFTYYLPLNRGPTRDARQRMLSTPLSEWQRFVLDDLRRAHRDIDALVTRIDVALWGHAMIRPTPGFIFGGARTRAAAPLGRIAFAHSDSSGLPLFEEAFDHGVNAAEHAIRTLEGGTGT